MTALARSRELAGFVGLVRLLAVGVLVAAGCGGGDSGASAGERAEDDGEVDGTITVLGASSLTDALAEVSAAFEDRHPGRSEEHTSELQSLMRISYAVFCLKKKK